MEDDEPDKPGWLNLEDNSCTAINASVINYYKKIGRKRDLEQYFSLSTAQGEVRDPTSGFWRRMKAQTDSSDSGEKPSESSTEVCRISIKCSVPDASCSQDNRNKPKHDSDSPPIITEEADRSEHSDNESVKSDNHSQKSLDATLDTSHKPLSPTSSVTSQRKLEWDSLADVGYPSEGDHKTSSSGLSTVERLALKQQFSNEDKDLELGPPTAHSTMVDPQPKGKKKARVTELHSKDVNVLELNMPTSDPHPSINVNLTKHISFNVENDGGITVEKTAKDISVRPAKVSVETEVTPKVQVDREIQTSLNKSTDAQKHKKSSKSSSNGAPVFISLNTLRKRIRRRRRPKRQSKRKEVPKDISAVEKSTEQVSEAESFEYMPGHMYNQGQKLGNSAGNKSSLESSGAVTTESSKSNVSFAQDLENSIQLLQKILKQNQHDSNLKKQLVKDLVKKLVRSRYKDDTSTDFLSGLSLSSKRLGQGEDYKSTTSTSDANTTEKIVRPKKSILRTDKFNANELASTSQSAPNLAAVSNDAPISSSFDNIKAVSQTESDVSSKETKSSQELYNKYLDALRREAYKKHLRNKEKLLKEKLVGSDGALRQLVQTDARSKRLRDLMKDLTRNNYNDGSGDASKLEGGSQGGQPEIDIRNQRSHSVFTLSSGNSDKKGEDDKERRKIDLRNRLQEEIEARLSSKDRPIKHHYCCCPHHTKFPDLDSSVQVKIQDCKAEEMLCSTTNKVSNLQTDIIACGQYTSCVCSGRNLNHHDGTCGCKCPHHGSKIPRASSQVTSARCGHSREATTSPRFGRDTCSTQIPNEKPCGYSKEPITSSRYDQDLAQPSTSRVRNVEVRHISHNPCSQKTKTVQKTQSQSSQTNVAANLLKSRSNDSQRIIEEQSGPTIDVIQESTRWTQTEISILPRIPEASLADINIINKAECAKLVSKGYREVPRLRPPEKSNDTAINTDQNQSIDETMNNRATLYHNEPQRPKQGNSKDMAIQSNLDVDGNINGNPESYSIPLKGTNMVLHVNVGSNTNEIDKEDRRDEGVNTDQVDYDDQVTSIREECTKAVQCQTEDIFDRPYVTQTIASRIVNRESNTDPKTNDRNKVTFSSKPKVTNTYLADNNRFSTYPKEQKKVMIRSNTDGILSEKCSKDPSGKGKDASVGTNTQFTKPEPALSEPRQIKSPREEREVVDNRNPKSSLNSDSSKSAKSDHSNRSTVKTSRPNSRPNSPKTKGPAIQLIHDRDNTRTGSSSKSDTSKSSRSDNNKTKSSYHSVGESTERSKEDLEPEGCNKEHACGEGCDCGCGEKHLDQPKDPALEMIRDITKRYSKQDLEKGDRKKCFKEIMSVLNYLLDTDDSTDADCPKISASTDNEVEFKAAKAEPPKEAKTSKIDKVTVCNKLDKITVCTATSPKRLVDKGIQLVPKKSRSKSVICESSDHPDSSDIPTTSSDKATCRILNKIKKECEKYHNQRCKCSSKRCEGSSTTSISCGDCRKVHHCSCKTHNVHKCKHRKPEKTKKQCVAYNLIIQTSDSFVGEETCDNKRELKNIVFKVPPKKHCATQYMPFKEMATKLEEYANTKRCPQTHYKFQRSRSLPNDSEISSTDDILKRHPGLTVRDYLEKNRPDFIENTSTRQNCLKMISESRANERAAHRELLSLQLQRDSAVNISAADIRRLAREVGVEIRRRKVAPKLISEREMKQRSEAIYKSLPEVVRKKDEARKESTKRTNLLMASIFKKNLQKKTLRGSVNISNYNTVIKI